MVHMVMVWLTLGMLGNFVCFFFCRQLGFSSSKLSFSKYNQSVKQLVSRSKCQADWVKTVCKDNKSCL